MLAKDVMIIVIGCSSTLIALLSLIVNIIALCLMNKHGKQTAPHSKGSRSVFLSVAASAL